MSFDRQRLNTVLSESGLPPGGLTDVHSSLFSATSLAVDAKIVAQIEHLVQAIESVIALPAYQERVLAWAPEISRLPQASRGVFFGYDFHLTEAGPRLIEINTNAGGALLNTCLLKAHGLPEVAAAIEQRIVAMFQAEWRLHHAGKPLRRIAIVDENPADQYLFPEFSLFKHLFEQNGIEAVITDPAHLTLHENTLLHEGKPVDLVYKRLTDFTLNDAVNAKLRAVFLAGGVVLTPHPRAHALYADKRNLMLLSDETVLLEFGVDAPTRQILLAGIPETRQVTATEEDFFWESRKRWFFKPAAGFGSRATYRGDKMTKRVFAEVVQGNYIAQEIVTPSLHQTIVDGVKQSMKVDVRSYVYEGHVQLLAARLYQGQTTNFRTPGGGFAPVFIR